MRIGHTGAGGTGKSTVAKLLATRLALQFKPGVAREVFAEKGYHEVDQHKMTGQQRLDLQLEILNRKFQQDRVYAKNAVLDRTPIDHIAYCLIRCQDAMTDQILADVEKQVIETTRLYDYVIFHPAYEWTFRINDDGFRENSRAYRTLVDVTINGLLSRYQIPHAVAPDADAESVADSILLFIRDREKAKQREGAPGQEARGRDREATGQDPRGSTNQGRTPAEKDAETHEVGEAGDQRAATARQ